MDQNPALTLEKIISFSFEGIGLRKLFWIVVLVRWNGWSDWFGWCGWP
jgi:hypothetical protein